MATVQRPLIRKEPAQPPAETRNAILAVNNVIATSTSNPLLSASGMANGTTSAANMSGGNHGTTTQTIVVSSVVEKTSNMERKETFITQKGGKIIQGLVEIQNADQEALLQDKRSLQSTLLLQKKREMQNVQVLLDRKRAEFSRRIEEAKEKGDELRAKQKQIKERVTKFEKFLKENDAKRIRANAKCITERKLKEQKDVEMSALQKQLHIELGKSERIQKHIRQLEGYEGYLQSIVDVLPPDYLDVHEPQINDIIMRYKTLTETNEDLFLEVQRNQEAIEKAHQTLQGLVKEKNDMVLVYNSKVGLKQKTLDRLKKDTLMGEEIVESKNSLGRERMRILSETKLAIDDLYERINEQNKKRIITTNTATVSTIPRKTGGGVEGDAENDGGKSSSINNSGGIGGSGGGPGLKSWIVKLHALQFRLLDLHDIVKS